MNNTMPENIAILGAAGAIGGAFVKLAATQYPESTIHAFSSGVVRTIGSNIKSHAIDYTSESSFEEAASQASQEKPLDLVVVANGLLHEGTITPEKSLRDLSAEKFYRLYEANTVVPALMAKYFLPVLNRDRRAIFAVLSARSGSISDNELGGWYAYRAAKAALNMIIKNSAIEVGRRNKQAVIVALHPGTVDSDLSAPFKNHVAKDKLFTPDYSVQKMMEVLQRLTAEHSGRLFSWEGEEIAP